MKNLRAELDIKSAEIEGMAQALKLIQSHFEALNKRIDAINEKLNRVSVLIDG